MSEACLGYAAQPRMVGFRACISPESKASPAAQFPLCGKPQMRLWENIPSGPILERRDVCKLNFCPGVYTDN